jgi:plastocyanin
MPAVIATAGLLAVVLAGCGSSSGSTSSAAPSAPAAGGTTTAGDDGTGVAVTLKDFSISLPDDSLKPGTYTFTVTNDGPSAHNLTVDGPGVEDAATPTFGSGGTKTLTVTLKDGTYAFYCSVPGHREAGMETSVKVGTGGSGTATSENGDDNGGGSSGADDG